jgi:hypothetical protein
MALPGVRPLFVAQRRCELIEQGPDVFRQLVRFPDFRERKLRHLVMVLKSGKSRSRKSKSKLKVIEVEADLQVGLSLQVRLSESQQQRLVRRVTGVGDECGAQHTDV